LLALRKEEHDLQAEYERLSARRVDASSAVVKARSREGSLPRPGDKGAGDLSTEYARTRLRFAMEKYDVLLERIQSARIELDTARAAFVPLRHRPPAHVSQAAGEAEGPMVLAAGLIAALALGTLAAALADLWSGKVVELWQIERGLGLPVLGEIQRPGS
jgi:hypothetical protein